MKLGVLTSSRADYGIYFHLLEKLKSDSFFSLEIIAFGTHLSINHGYTLKLIEQDEYPVIHKISSLITNDDEESIATSYGLTVLKFSRFWQINQYDLVFCLGDRFEMSAAVQAGIPFGVKFAHIHGGETTLGAIDNIYRHQITLASELHFTATKAFKKKIKKIIGSSDKIFSFGSLSLDSVKSFVPTDKNLFLNDNKIPNKPFVLVTFHPESQAFNDNISFLKEIKNALSVISKNLFLVITMPNADSKNLAFRDVFNQLKTEFPSRVLLVENFGKQNYFSAMTYAKTLIGNSSSGIIEAASFSKYIVNVGNRQKGRIQSENVLNCDFVENQIVTSTFKAIELGNFSGKNIYYRNNVAHKIVETIKNLHD